MKNNNEVYLEEETEIVLFCDFRERVVKDHLKKKREINTKKKNLLGNMIPEDQDAKWILDYSPQHERG